MRTGAGASQVGRDYHPRRYSLMNSLLMVVNDTESDDSRHVIARYLLHNFDRLHELNVYEMAAECYTSRTGIRRFCESIYYDNFTDLKAAAYEWELHAKFFADYANQPDYRRHLTREVDRTLAAINRLVSEEQLDDLARRIRDAETVVFVSSTFSSMALPDLQQAMLMRRKLTHILTDSMGRESRLRDLRSDDVVVVVSASGVYGRVVMPLLAESVAHRALVTLSHDGELASFYDDVFHLSDVEYPGRRTAFAKYGVGYFFDLLCNRYYELCKDE